MEDNSIEDHTGRETEMLYQAYLVRLWRDTPHAFWRASAKHIHTGKEHGFANLENLFVFLLAQTSEPGYE